MRQLALGVNDLEALVLALNRINDRLRHLLLGLLRSAGAFAVRVSADARRLRRLHFVHDVIEDSAEFGKAFDGKRLLVLFGLLMIGVGLSMLRGHR